MENSRDIVLFLGAGFSFEAGFPLISSFGPASYIEFNNIKEHDRGGSRSFKEAAPMLINAGRIYIDFQQFCGKAKKYVDVNEKNMEEIFSMAEILRQSKYGPLKLRGEEYTIYDIEYNIKLWLWKIYQQCPPLTGKEENKYKCNFHLFYKSFFENLLEVSSKVAVITTNYDLLIEYGIYDNGSLCCYPLNEVSNDSEKVFNLIKIGKRDDPYVKCVRNCDDLIKLCKLHGSINFFMKKEEKKLYISGYIGYDEKIGHSPLYTKRPAVFALDAIWKIRKDHGENLYPEIVPPTYAKLENKPWLIEMWSEALTLLKFAKKIIFIGYSMPKSDGFMRAMIQAAMAERIPKLPLNVYVIDPDKSVHRRFWELFKPVSQKIGFISKKFTTAIDDIKKIIISEK